ncbi:hypothetical protein [Methylocaldum gracile]|uniref:hypothetical protein n=1 Tax=unclassified Methylocaldum TaxID=2622260 RepID=UPI00105DA0B3
MNAIEKWAERVYAETDFGRNVATSLSGLLGLGVYLIVGDWVIAAFASIIFFPVARLTATAIHARVSRGADRRAKRKDAEQIYRSLSDEERAVVSEFVAAGGCVLTWHHMNHCPVSGPAIESLIQREVLSTSMTADGMRETFVLDTAFFEIGVSHAKAANVP